MAGPPLKVTGQEVESAGGGEHTYQANRQTFLDTVGIPISYTGRRHQKGLFLVAPDLLHMVIVGGEMDG